MSLIGLLIGHKQKVQIQKKKKRYFVACKLWYLLHSLPGVSWKRPSSAFASLFNWHDKFIKHTHTVELHIYILLWDWREHFQNWKFLRKRKKRLYGNQIERERDSFFFFFFWEKVRNFLLKNWIRKNYMRNILWHWGKPKTFIRRRQGFLS